MVSIYGVPVTIYSEVVSAYRMTVSLYHDVVNGYARMVTTYRVVVSYYPMTVTLKIYLCCSYALSHCYFISYYKNNTEAIIDDVGPILASKYKVRG